MEIKYKPRRHGDSVVVRRMFSFKHRDHRGYRGHREIDVFSQIVLCVEINFFDSL